MSKQAWIYIWSVFIVGGGLAVQSLSTLPTVTIDWVTFVPILILATLVQLFEAEAPNRQLLYLHFIFFFAALLLLPAPLFVLIVATAHLVEWAKVRWLTPESPHLRHWYLQPFNIANHIIAGFAALMLLQFGVTNNATDSTITILLYLAATLTYVVINHLLVGVALKLARGIGISESGVMQIRSLLPDVIMAGLGCVVAVLWTLNPAWLLLALSPVVMMYQSLMVPQLAEEASTDGKTGLLNARYFQKALTQEFERAKSDRQPLAFIMADLDYLRNINNTYGHLAGDVVISGLGKIIRENVREGDSAGRFGGEEFAILLPGADMQMAQQVAERIRRVAESATFVVPNLEAPIRATLSLGVAVFPDDVTTMTDLHLAADIAVYQAKEQGRNRVVCVANIPEAIARGLPTQAASQSTAIPASPMMPTTPPSVEPQSIPQDKPYRKRRQTTLPTIASLSASAHNSTSKWLRSYVISVIGSGIVVALLGYLISTPANPWLILGLSLIALIFELLHVSLNGRNTISVSIAIGVAAAILTGIYGVMAVSGAIALAHTIRQQVPLYRFLFNWSVHLLAGALLVLIITTFSSQQALPSMAYLLLTLILMMPIYFLIDVGLVIVAVSLSSGHHLRSIWHSEYRWALSHYWVLGFIGGFMAVAYQTIGALGIVIAIVPLLLARYAQYQYVTHTQESIRELRRVNQELRQTNQDLVKANEMIGCLNEHLVLLNDEVVETLARFFDARDPNAGNHVAQVALYATLLGEKLGLEGERLQHLRWAAFLHDIGKIAIPETLLFKPDRLTPIEYEQIKSHVTRGADLLADSPATRHLAAFVRQHHERWDGRGYPDGLAGEQITLEARILNLCDSVEAMASDRPYSLGRTPEEILAEVRTCAGSQFDPQITALFLELVEEHGHELLVNTALFRQLLLVRSARSGLSNSETRSEELLFRRLTSQTKSGSLYNSAAD